MVWKLMIDHCIMFPLLFFFMFRRTDAIFANVTITLKNHDSAVELIEFSVVIFRYYNM